VVEICNHLLGYALSPQFLKSQIIFKIKISGKDRNIANPPNEESFYNKLVVSSRFQKTEVKFIHKNWCKNVADSFSYTTDLDYCYLGKKPVVVW
jgi:hypothetical protein